MSEYPNVLIRNWTSDDMSKIVEIYNASRLHEVCFVSAQMTSQKFETLIKEEKLCDCYVPWAESIFVVPLVNAAPQSFRWGTCSPSDPSAAWRLPRPNRSPPPVYWPLGRCLSFYVWNFRSNELKVMSGNVLGADLWPHFCIVLYYNILLYYTMLY